MKQGSNKRERLLFWQTLVLVISQVFGPSYAERSLSNGFFIGQPHRFRLLIWMEPILYSKGFFGLGYALQRDSVGSENLFQVSTIHQFIRGSVTEALLWTMDAHLGMGAWSVGSSNNESILSRSTRSLYMYCMRQINGLFGDFYDAIYLPCFARTDRWNPSGSQLDSTIVNPRDMRILTK